MNQELQRLTFLEQRDGKEAALEFARTTYKVYKRSLMQSRKRGHQKPHHASQPEYRRSFIESCIVFRKYLAEKGAHVGNRCLICNYSRLNAGKHGHCYMFEEEPYMCNSFKSINIGTMTHFPPSAQSGAGLAPVILHILNDNSVRSK